jgi:glycosyltransferase involved in cell wall biosynthesis
MNEIAVIIPTFNSVDFLKDAIKSVQSQTFRGVTLHVVDNGSTDSTVETLQREQISYSIELGGRAGAARMNGVQRTQEPFIFFLDHDDVLYPDALKVLYDKIVSSETDLCYGALRKFGMSSPTTSLAPLASSTLVRRTAFQLVGDFEPSNYSWIDWMARGRDAGIRESFVEIIVGGRRIHDSNMSREQKDMKPYFGILREKLDRGDR